MKRLLFSLTLISCFSFSAFAAKMPTAFPDENTIQVDLYDGSVIVSCIQYEYENMIVSKYKYFSPVDKNKKIAILQFQIQSPIKKKEYDFFNVTVSNDNVTLTPALVRYFRGNAAMGTDWGFEESILNGLRITFKKSEPYTIMLGYICDPETRFTQVSIGGKTIKFSSEAIKKGTFINKFIVPTDNKSE